MNLVIRPDPEHLADAAADFIAGLIGEAPEARVTLGLAGGSSPKLTYERLVEKQVPWGRVDAWLSDERWVPHHHPESNGRMAAEALMDHVEARYLRPRFAPPLLPADSAAYYEADLRSIHGGGRPDIVLLGMGDDGHTASLFPGTAALTAPPHRWFVANHVPQLGVDRLTSTYSLLHAARHVVFLVAGATKADALRQAIEPSDDRDPVPAAGVTGGQAEVWWLVDEAAASQLSYSLRA